MVTIGDFIHLQTFTLLIPKGQETKIKLKVEDDEEIEPLSIIIRFEETEPEGDEKPKSGLTVRGDENNAYITFLNWDKPFGSSLQKPVAFANSNEGDEIFLLASARPSGEIYELKAQFLKKESKNEPTD